MPEDALKLPESERAAIAARLIESLDPDVDEDAPATGDVEIARRLQELDSGRVKPVPWPEARRQITGASDATPGTCIPSGSRGSGWCCAGVVV
ncbi:MAG TPA: addiction module protein [Gemmataceae bacterium]|nr:addiction module protein [Gemmataceae bacterium]